MKGSRPTQAYLSAETDMTKTSETQKVIEEMVDGLNDHRIDDIGEFFSKNFITPASTGVIEGNLISSFANCNSFKIFIFNLLIDH